MSNFIQELFQELFFKNKRQQSIPVMDAALSPNHRLDECTVVKDCLKMPDDLAIDSKGNLYVSSENKVFQFPQNQDEFREAHIYAEFKGVAGALNFHPDGRLMVCVEGEGVWFVGDSGPIEKLQLSTGKPIHCPTCVLAGPEDFIYVTDGSTHNGSEDWVRDLMEKRATGRLIRFNMKTGEGEILLSKLKYPHGICLDSSTNSLILTESWAHRISQFPLNDICLKTRKDFFRNLPGYPARIIPSADGNYWLSLFAMRTHLVELILQEENYRKEMIRQIDPDYWVAPALSSGNSYLEPLQGGQVKQFGEIKPWAPPRSYGLVVKMDQYGEILESLHSRSGGQRHGVTGLCQDGNHLYLVSKGHGFILKTEEKHAKNN